MNARTSAATAKTMPASTSIATPKPSTNALFAALRNESPGGPPMLDAICAAAPMEFLAATDA